MNKEIQRVVNEQVKNGAQVCNSTVKAVFIKERNDRDVVTFKLVDKHSLTHVEQADGNYAVEQTDTAWVAVSSVAACIGEIPALARFKTGFVGNPQTLAILLAGAKVSILQTITKKGMQIVNPFTGSTSKEPADHDTIISYLVDVDLGEGTDFAEALRAEEMRRAIDALLKTDVAEVRAKQARRFSTRVTVTVEEPVEEQEEDKKSKK